MLGDVVLQVARENLENVQDRGGFVYASCPFHGVDRSPSFWLKKETGSWKCWTCGESGKDLQSFLKAVGGSGSAEVRRALRIAQKEAEQTAVLDKARKARASIRSLHSKTTLPANELLPIYRNPIPSLVSQGFNEDLLREHEIGYDLQREKITFPIFDIQGGLVGISGRLTQGTGPKYKVYSGRHVNGDGVMVPGELGEWFPWYQSEEIRNHLWRGDKVFPRVMRGEEGWNYIIIVEGFKAALWMVQCGYTSTVALMGASMTEQQERVIRRMGVQTFVFLDNNEAGRKGSSNVCWRLGDLKAGCYEVSYDPVRDLCEDEKKYEKLQPDDLDEEVLAILLAEARARHRLRKELRRKMWRQKQ